MKTIEIFIGTKAQLVKMAPILLELEKQKLLFRFILTGQHENTINELISSFGITTEPEFFDQLIERDTANSVFKWFVRSLLTILKSPKNRNTIVVSHGDTLSTLVAALYAKKIGAKFAHIEAGLRSFNIVNPFPEELIRIIVSKLSSFHFAPGDWAVKNINSKNTIIDTDLNTIYDSLMFALKRQDVSHKETESKRYAIVSLHRFENLKNTKRLTSIINQIEDTSQIIPIKFVLHPVTVKVLTQKKLLDRIKNNANITLIDRMNYIDFIRLLSKAKFLITDGGSNQEEAYYIGIPCLIMRSHTERTEGLNSTSLLSNYDPVKTSEFVLKHAYSTWELKSIKVSSPSKIIVDNFAKLIEVG